MIGKVDSPRQPIDGLDGSLPQRGCTISSFVRFDNDRNNKVQIFLDIGAKSQKRVKDFDLGVNPLLVQLAIEDFKNWWQDSWKERLELSIQSLAQGFDEGDNGQLQ
jgi:hypothetical protein